MSDVESDDSSSSGSGPQLRLGMLSRVSDKDCDAWCFSEPLKAGESTTTELNVDRSTSSLIEVANLKLSLQRFMYIVITASQMQKGCDPGAYHRPIWHFDVGTGIGGFRTARIFVWASTCV